MIIQSEWYFSQAPEDLQVHQADIKDVIALVSKFWATKPFVGSEHPSQPMWSVCPWRPLGLPAVSGVSPCTRGFPFRVAAAALG
jgi:hypothetical protein